VTAEMERFRAWLAPRLHEYAEVHDPFRIDHTVQVTSFGGSGTTALCNYLLSRGVDLQKGPAQWPFKHRRTPPPADGVPDGFRVVYIVSDPRDAIVSIFRRNYQLGHYGALRGHDPDPETHRRLVSLETFLDAGHDEFELADHVARWRAHDPGYPVLFLRYEYVAEVWDDLLAFVGLQPPQPPLRLRARRSNWRTLPRERRRQLDVLYGELARTIEELPPLHVA
jgi:hypothetical protein